MTETTTPGDAAGDAGRGGRRRVRGRRAAAAHGVQQGVVGRVARVPGGHEEGRARGNLHEQGRFARRGDRRRAAGLAGAVARPGHPHHVRHREARDRRAGGVRRGDGAAVPELPNRCQIKGSRCYPYIPVFSSMHRSAMAKCQSCNQEISEEQFKNFNKLCPTCFPKYKKTCTIFMFICAFAVFGVVILKLVFYFMNAAAGHIHVDDLISAVAYAFLCQILFFAAWRFQFAPGVAERTNSNKQEAWWCISILPAIFIIILLAMVGPTLA